MNIEHLILYAKNARYNAKAVPKAAPMALSTCAQTVFIAQRLATDKQVTNKAIHSLRAVVSFAWGKGYSEINADKYKR